MTTEHAKLVAPKSSAKVELKLGPEGFQSPEDPAKRRARTSFDRGGRKVARASMQARWMRIESDGTLQGTHVFVKNQAGEIVMVGGMTHLEFVAERGKPRVGAVASLLIQNDRSPEMPPELAGKPVIHGGEVVVEDGIPKQVGGVPQSITADIFGRT